MANTRRKPESTSTPLPKMTRKDLIQSVIGKTPRKKFLSEGQRHYFELLENKEKLIDQKIEFFIKNGNLLFFY